MGSLIRAANLGGGGDLMQKLGADPKPLLKRFDTQPRIEPQEEALISLDAFVRMLEASSAALDWSGLQTLPFALAGLGHPRTHRGNSA